MKDKRSCVHKEVCTPVMICDSCHMTIVFYKPPMLQSLINFLAPRMLEESLGRLLKQSIALMWFYCRPSFLCVEPALAIRQMRRTSLQGWNQPTSSTSFRLVSLRRLADPVSSGTFGTLWAALGRTCCGSKSSKGPLKSESDPHCASVEPFAFGRG